MSEILLKKYIGLHVKYLLFFSEFNWTWIFWTFFFPKNTHTSLFLKIRSVGAEDKQTGRQTDVIKLTVAFGNSVNASKKLRL